MKFVACLLLMVSVVQSQAPAKPPALQRDQIYRLLVQHKIAHPERTLVHYHHTCNLKIEGRWYPVIDMQETIPGPMTAGGNNLLLILSPALTPVRQIEYIDNRPLFCLENRIYVYGDLRLDTGAKGNVLTFSQGGKEVSLSHVEPQAYPLPPTKARKGPLQ